MKRREDKRGEGDRRRGRESECLVDFIFWLLSRFVGHSCFPVRRPYSPFPLRSPACNAPRPRRPPRSGAHNAATVNCSVGRE